MGSIVKFKNSIYVLMANCALLHDPSLLIRSRVVALALSVGIGFYGFAFNTQLATAAEESLPSIESHSTTSFAVYREDSIELEVRVDGEDTQYKWVRNEAVECRTSKCLFDTKSWSVGQHQISVIMYNDFGSRFLRYTVNVLQAPPDGSARIVSPVLVDPTEEIDIISNDDQNVVALKGVGYSYGESKVQVIGEQSRLLQWNERLKTQPDGILQFGLPRKEEHFIFQGSSVVLSANDTGDREVRLEKGIIRSRHLSQEDPNWSISIGNWLRLNPNSDSDFLVEKVPGKGKVAKSVVITVIRGSVGFDRLQDLALSSYGRFPGLGKLGSTETASDGNSISQGSQVRIYKLSTKSNKSDERQKPKGQSEKKNAKSIAFEIMDPNADLIADTLKMTTPQFFLTGDVVLVRSEPGQKIKVLDGNEGFDFPLVEKKSKSLKKTLKKAKKALKEKDYILVLSLLIPFEDRATVNYKLSLTLARASRAVFIEEQASQFFETAMALRKLNPAAYFEKGEMLLESNFFEDASSYLEMAAERDYPNFQLLNYSRGVVDYNREKMISAQQKFAYSLWDRTDPELTRSTKEYLAKIRDEAIFDFRSEVGLFSDSNVFRLEKAEEMPEGYKSNVSNGLTASVGFSLVFFDSWKSSWTLLYDMTKTVYSDLNLKEVGTTIQNISLPLKFRFGGAVEEDAVFGFGIMPYVEMIHLGSERARDAAGVDTFLFFPVLWSSPSIHYESAIRKDPLPTRNDVIDPTLWEVVAESERSNRYGASAFYLTPWKTEKYEFLLGIKSGVTAFSKPETAIESYIDTSYMTTFSYFPIPRTSIKFDIDYKTRDFYDSRDARSDTNTNFDLVWVWFYTPNFSHSISGNYEIQSSSREDSGYVKSVAAAALSLSF